MKREEKRCRATAVGSGCDAEAPSGTRTMEATVAAAGTTVCITMHNWQWSASVWLE